MAKPNDLCDVHMLIIFIKNLFSFLVMTDRQFMFI